MTLACHGFGFPAPIITWSDAWNQVMENGHILQLPKINRNMAGQYSCTASNSCGTDSRKVDIDVRCEFISAMKRILQATICTSWAPIHHIYLSIYFILCCKEETSLLCGMHSPIVCFITQNSSHVDGFACVCTQWGRLLHNSAEKRRTKRWSFTCANTRSISSDIFLGYVFCLFCAFLFC